MLLAFVLITCQVSFAWLSWIYRQDITEFDGSLYTGYFYTGTGEPDDPYIITRPIHYQNMLKLMQYDTVFCTKSYKIGYDLDGDGSIKVFNYGDDGKLLSGTTDVLNMAGYPVEPIGDTNFGFSGQLDGSNLTVSKLHVTVNQNNFGLASDNFGIFGKVTASASVKDIYFDSVTLDVTGIKPNALGKCYCGYIAGSIEAAESFSNTYINNCSISGTPTNVVLCNDWGYFGHCDNAATLPEFIARARGDVAGFGGSLDMLAMYNRVEYMQAKASLASIPANIYYNGVYQHTVDNAYSIQYFNNDSIGSAVWYPYDTNDFSGNYNYLAGNLASVDLYHTVQQESGYYIHSDIRYMSNTDTALQAVTAVTDNTTVWSVSGNITNKSSIYISTLINGRRYYLRYRLGVSLSTTSAAWTLEASGNGYKLKSGNNYLRYNNGWTVTTTAKNGTIFEFTPGTIDIITNTEIQYNYNGSTAKNTVLPLISNDDYTVAERNTGYIISGSRYINTDHDFPIKSGDIRISKYAAAGSTTSTNNNLRASYNGNTKSLTNVYTINLSGARQTVNKANYKRYAEAETDLLQSISGGNVYGLHFMDSFISVDNLVVASQVKLNDQTYFNYQLPADSIDFNLVESGYITFFAGTYFSGNDSFFSLHQIMRDQDNTITSIKEISEIYGSTDPRSPYVYQYADGSFSDALDASYSLIFSTRQIKQQESLTSNAIYYFEIPVNQGEYALGSVDGGTGAYLIYLDIGTNGGENIKSTVDDFGSVEYRSVNDTALSSICLITYEQSDGADLEIDTRYDAGSKTYYISCTGSGNQEIDITLLNTDYIINFNGQLLNKIETKKFIV